MKKNKQLGFSLIEILLALAIIVSLSVAAFFLYSKISNDRRISEEFDNINTLVASLRSSFAGQKATYNITEEIILKSNLVPERMLSRDKTFIKSNISNSPISVNGSEIILGEDVISYPSFSFEYQDVSKSDCESLGSKFIPTAAKFQTNNGELSGVGYGNNPNNEDEKLNLKNVQRICDSDNNYIKFEFPK